jgi:hypothetical protein
MAWQPGALCGGIDALPASERCIENLLSGFRLVDTLHRSRLVERRTDLTDRRIALTSEGWDYIRASAPQGSPDAEIIEGRLLLASIVENVVVEDC